jgi:hypothetical protein
MTVPSKPKGPVDPAQPALDLQAPLPSRRSGTRSRRGRTADGRIGQTLRLSPDAWEQLKVLAARERVNAHDLLVEGVNLLFRERGLPMIA